ncbi:MAG: hypothetical protein CFE34_10535 [Rhodobacteraceae bacterium PARR1]|nr:MAG: hypothetical protein CFE34_10535 [Rhodobacteraceae bacterium PARR1]
MIIAVALMAAEPAFAGVCADLRPGWDASLGAVTWWHEVPRVLSSFPGLVVLASLGFGLWRPHLWISTACAVPALAFAGLLSFSYRAETAVLARAEGCMASVWPVAVLLVALAGLTIVRAWQRG